MSSSGAAQTASRWYQSKRIPLYLVVGTTLGAAVAFLRSNATDTRNAEDVYFAMQTESDTTKRRHELHEVEPGGEHSNAVESRPGFGASSQGSTVRTAIRSSGMMDGQDTDGIFPNAAISKKMGDILGPHHTIPVQTEVKKE